MNNHHDVLVIGAGPAGAAAGYWLAKEGLDVVMIDKGSSLGIRRVVMV